MSRFAQVLLLAAGLAIVGCRPTEPEPGNGEVEEAEPAWPRRTGPIDQEEMREYYDWQGPFAYCLRDEALPIQSEGVEVVWETLLPSHVSTMPSFGYVALQEDYYFAAMGSARRLHKVDRHDGRSLDSISTGAPFHTADGEMVGAGSGMFIETGADGLLYLFSQGMTALDPVTLAAPRWVASDALDGFHVPPVAVGDGDIVVQWRYGNTSRLTPKGNGFETVWNYRAGESEQHQRMLHDSERGHIIVHSLVSLDEGRRWITFAWRVADGRIAWSFDGAAMGPPRMLGRDRIAITQIVREDERSFLELQVRSAETGDLLHAVRLQPHASGQLRPYEGDVWIATSPAGDRVYAVQQRRDDSKPIDCCAGVLTAFDADLEPLWRREVPWPTYDHVDDAWWEWGNALGEIRTPPVVGPDGTVYVVSSNCYLYAFDPDGMLRWWERRPYPATSELLVSDDGILYAPSVHWFETDRGETGTYTLVRAYRGVPEAPAAEPCAAGVWCPEPAEVDLY